MNNRLIIISIFLLLCKSSFSQFTVRGTVFNEENEKLEYFNVVLYKSIDTTFIAGGAFINGEFELSIKHKTKCILKISYVGLQEHIEVIDFNLRENYTLNNIVLNIEELPTIVVSAKKPKYTSKNGNIILNVQTTVLSEVGTSLDVLKRAPGVTIDNLGNINVFGKGTPKIFIDGKEITSVAELQLLQSSDINKVEVNKNPSSEYSASANSVINIKTKRIKQDVLNAEIYNRSYFAREISNNSGVKINNKTGKFSTFISYQYEKNKSNDYFSDFDNNYQENYTIINKSNRENNISDDKHLFLIGNTFAIDSLKKVSIQYGYNNLQRDILSETTQEISKSNEVDNIQRNISSDALSKKSNNNISLFYNQDFGIANKFTTTLDFLDFSYNDIAYIKEENDGINSNSRIENNSNNQVYSFKSDFKITLPKEIKTKFGIKISNIKSTGHTTIYSDLSTSKEESDINDLIGASYVTLSKTVKRLFINVGVRDEITKSIIFQDNKNIIDTVYNNLFPALMLNYSISDKYEITFNYNKKISRPFFKEINPTYLYIDSLAYRVGNPLLQPTISNGISLMLSLFNSLFISGEFNLNTNERVFAALNDEYNPDIIKYTYINIPNSKHLVFDISYNYSGKKYSLYSSTGIDFPFLDIPYLDTYKEVRKPMWYISLYSDYSFNDFLSFYCNLYYQSDGEDQLTYFGSMYNVSGGLQLKLLHKSLIVSIDINDAFNTSDMSWVDQYGTIENGQVPDYDSRYVKFAIKYYFNDFKNVFKNKSGIVNEKKRINN
jgi:hypothetical protein